MSESARGAMSFLQVQGDVRGGQSRGSRVILNMGALWGAIKRAAIKGLFHSPGGGGGYRYRDLFYTLGMAFHRLITCEVTNIHHQKRFPLLSD